MFLKTLLLSLPESCRFNAIKVYIFTSMMKPLPKSSPHGRTIIVSSPWVEGWDGGSHLIFGAITHVVAFQQTLYILFTNINTKLRYFPKSLLKK